MSDVDISSQPFERFLPLLGSDRLADFVQLADAVRARFAGRAIWNINSTATGGGVAEMLHSLLPYVRGLDVDARWLVIRGTPEFFRVTKRLHHALHGSMGDGSRLDDEARAIYEGALGANAAELTAAIRAGDVVLLHDPQTAGLAPHLMRSGALIIWRCHIGCDSTNAEVECGWRFLAPYLRGVPVTVFSRRTYVPDYCDQGRATIITPSIDAFSAKNQDLDEATVRAILVHVGLVEGPQGNGTPGFTRQDGSPGRVDRQADLLRMGRAPAWGTPLLLQVSRWDPLKDPVGVMLGFATLVGRGEARGAELVLAGPNVNAIADDPESTAVLGEVFVAWRRLPHAVRNLIHVASLPMADAEENGAIVNALQRHATVVVQKSLNEGFGLTVTEAMWKARPVVASAVGGIQDQIDDEVHGLLLKDPTDREAFAVAVSRLLDDPPFACRLGENARRRVREEFLGLHHLAKLARLLEKLDQEYEAAGRPEQFRVD